MYSHLNVTPNPTAPHQEGHIEHVVAVCKVKEVKSPYNHTQLGFRLVAAIPNREAFNYYKQEYIQSFAKRFIIKELGDFPGVEGANAMKREFEQRIRNQLGCLYTNGVFNWV